MNSPTVYLISGESRGIGFGLVHALSQRLNTIVFAGARDPASATALQALAKEKPEVGHVVRLTSADVEDNKAAIEEIRTKAGQLDVVIANAGIAQYQGPIVSTPVEQYKAHSDVDTIAPIVLFQAAHSLLIKSPSGKPQFSVISSVVGSISLGMSMQAAAYGMSKAAVSYLVKQLHLEHASDGLIAMAIHPRWVATDMGNGGARARGMVKAPTELGESVTGIVGIVDGATRENSNGKFLNAVPVAGSKELFDLAEEELPG